MQRTPCSKASGNGRRALSCRCQDYNDFFRKIKISLRIYLFFRPEIKLAALSESGPASFENYLDGWMDSENSIAQERPGKETGFRRRFPKFRLGEKVDSGKGSGR
jgi:hypothetical protein